MRAFRAVVLHVFIDTNVYLDFFRFGQDTLDALRKLATAIRDDHVKLWTTEQVRDELRRSREGRVDESLKALDELRPTSRMPSIARNLPGYQALEQARSAFDHQLSDARQELVEQFDDGKLAADLVLEELLSLTHTIPVSDEILEAARRRVDRGNPPGKKGSLGDAINWEALLSACKPKENLYLVTRDGDYGAHMDKERVSEFLVHEWRREKESEIKAYQRISSFTADVLPEIMLATEREKETRIGNLINSGSFEQTHRAIAALRQYSDFTEQQVADLLAAAASNSQIGWIARDDDVQAFYRRLLAVHGGNLDHAARERYDDLFADADADDDDDSAYTDASDYYVDDRDEW